MRFHVLEAHFKAPDIVGRAETTARGSINGNRDDGGCNGSEMQRSRARILFAQVVPGHRILRDTGVMGATKLKIAPHIVHYLAIAKAERRPSFCILKVIQDYGGIDPIVGMAIAKA